MLNEEEIKRVFDQVMNIWVNPEIERRRKEGQIKDGLEIRRAQVVFTPEHPNEVKLNEEIIIKAEVKANREIVKSDEIKESDINEIKGFIVDCPPNSGHITLFRFLDKWIIVFDVRYNEDNIKKILKRSKDFYESAKDDLKNGRIIPFFSNCWDSAELSTICHMLSIGNKNKGHGENVKNFIEWSKLGNVNKKHANTLSHLKELRRLKYSINESTNENFSELLNIVREMIDEAEKI